MTQGLHNKILDDFYRDCVSKSRQYLEQIFEVKECEAGDFDISSVSKGNTFPTYLANPYSWKVKVNSCIGEIYLIVLVPQRYPDNFPRIYLTSALFKKIYPIPHLDKYGFICTRDPRTVIINDDTPGEAIKALIDVALEIIEAGVNKSNEHEYFDELIAYWDDNVSAQMLSNFTILNKATIAEMYIITGSLLGSRDITSNMDKSSMMVWLAKFKLSIKEVLKDKVLFLPVRPELPFNIVNFNDVYKFLLNVTDAESKKLIQDYYSRPQNMYSVVCSIPKGNEFILFGWSHIGWQDIRVNGYRNGHAPFNIIINSHEFRSKKLIKIKIIRLDEQSLNNRIS